MPSELQDAVPDIVIGGDQPVEEAEYESENEEILDTKTEKKTVSFADLDENENGESE